MDDTLLVLGQDQSGPVADRLPHVVLLHGQLALDYFTLIMLIGVDLFVDENLNSLLKLINLSQLNVLNKQFHLVREVTLRIEFVVGGRQCASLEGRQPVVGSDEALAGD